VENSDVIKQLASEITNFDSNESVEEDVKQDNENLVDSSDSTEETKSFNNHDKSAINVINVYVH
jgi:hypothetical protein